MCFGLFQTKKTDQGLQVCRRNGLVDFLKFWKQFLSPKLIDSMTLPRSFTLLYNVAPSNVGIDGCPSFQPHPINFLIYCIESIWRDLRGDQCSTFQSLHQVYRCMGSLPSRSIFLVELANNELPSLDQYLLLSNSSCLTKYMFSNTS